MKEVQITAWCDICWHESERRSPSAQMWRISITGAAGRQGVVKELEFCDEHGPMMLPLITAYDAAAAADDSPAVVRAVKPRQYGPHPRREGDFECPICGHSYQSTANTITHIMQVHRKGERPYPANNKCEHCGQSWDAPQPLARHLQDVHNVDLIARVAEPALARDRLRQKRSTA